jgi:hypothetical protein
MSPAGRKLISVVQQRPERQIHENATDNRMRAVRHGGRLYAEVNSREAPLVQRFAITMTYSPSSGRPLLRECESGEQRGQVMPSERPFEGPSGGFIVVLKREPGDLQGGEIGESPGVSTLRWTIEK